LSPVSREKGPAAPRRLRWRRARCACARAGRRRRPRAGSAPTALARQILYHPPDAPPAPALCRCRRSGQARGTPPIPPRPPSPLAVALPRATLSPPTASPRSAPVCSPARATPRMCLRHASGDDLSCITTAASAPTPLPPSLFPEPGTSLEHGPLEPDARGVDSLDPDLVENAELFPLGDAAASLQKDLVADDDKVAVTLPAVFARIHKACGHHKSGRITVGAQS
jgi:hypothetical protein